MTPRAAASAGTWSSASRRLPDSRRLSVETSIAARAAIWARVRPCWVRSLVPMLRRLPRRLDRISGSLEGGRLGVNVRLLADAGDRRYLIGLVHQLVLTFLAATCGVMSVLILGLHGGPNVTHTVTLYVFLGYCLLVFAGVLGLRVLVVVFRLDGG